MRAHQLPQTDSRPVSDTNFSHARWGARGQARAGSDRKTKISDGLAGKQYRKAGVLGIATLARPK